MPEIDVPIIYQEASHGHISVNYITRYSFNCLHWLVKLGFHGPLISGPGLLFPFKLPALTGRSHHLLHLNHPILGTCSSLDFWDTPLSWFSCFHHSAPSLPPPLPFPFFLCPKCKDSPMFCPRILPCLFLTLSWAILSPLNSHFHTTAHICIPNLTIF